MNQLCDFTAYENISKLFRELYVPEYMYFTMLNVAPQMNDTFAFCKLFDQWVNCEEIFFPVVTDAGFCYSFNTLRLPEYLTDECVSFHKG